MVVRIISKHIKHYISLFGVFIFGFIAFYFFSYDRLFQLMVAIATAVAYIAWGIIHHYLHKDLYLSVILEYFALAILGVVIIASLLFRS